MTVEHRHDRKCVHRDARGHIRLTCTSPSRVIAYAGEPLRVVRAARHALAAGDPLRVAFDVAIDFMLEAVAAARVIREGDIVREASARDREKTYRVAYLSGHDLEVALLDEHPPSFPGDPGRRIRRYVSDLVKVTSAPTERTPK